MDKFICIHGHFYQPPRENPWLEDVEIQESAHPFHDWNARITEECYRQNAASRILGTDRKIKNIVNNYSNMNFNFGPTLLSWLKLHELDVYKSIIEADKESKKKFSGHGSAMAQSYNHMILPLANTRDKHTQVIWGIRDFEQTFNRKPEGMWLPETAVNTDTLEVLAEHGIKFTVLAPRQAQKVRKIGNKKWSDVKDGSIDTYMPYLYNLPSGKSISIFFYNGDVSHDVAYGGLLHSGENFAGRLLDAFGNETQGPRLVNIATDGESFGHHHNHGEMALAYCIYHIKKQNLARITIYPEFLEKFPPTHEVMIHENSSWSCVHGIERWRSNCGCCGDQSLSGQQQWREPLRNALDFLRDRLGELFGERMSQFTQDPWQARDEYIEAINDRSEENVNKFILKITGKLLSEDEKNVFLKLLESQRMGMLMYTSCGWFFDRISGIEAVQVLRYASRAMQLYQDLTDQNLVNDFKNILNKDETAEALKVYEEKIEPIVIDLHRVGAHFALSSIFSEHLEKQQQIYCYKAVMQDYKLASVGYQKLATGRAIINSTIIQETQEVDFATLHMGGYNLFTALTHKLPDEEFKKLREDLENAFYKGDTSEVLRLMNIRYGGKNYSIWHLFKDEQRRIVYELLTDTWEEIERTFRHLYEQNHSIMLLLRKMNMPLPKALAASATYIINHDLGNEIKSSQINTDNLRTLIGEAERLSLELDTETLRFEASAKISQLMKEFADDPEDLNKLTTIERTLEILEKIVQDMDLQSAQNKFFNVSKAKYHEMKVKASSQEEFAKEWIDLFEQVAGHLKLVIE